MNTTFEDSMLDRIYLTLEKTVAVVLASIPKLDRVGRGAMPATSRGAYFLCLHGVNQEDPLL